MLGFINRLAKYLKEEFADIPIKATPEAIMAPQSYDLTDAAKGVILLWLDSVPSYYDPNRKIETEAIKTHVFYRNNLVVVSVGLRTLADAPDLDLLVERLEAKLIHLVIGEYLPLRPISISKMQIDANAVFWRQMYFETKLKIIGHQIYLDL